MFDLPLRNLTLAQAGKGYNLFEDIELNGKIIATYPCAARGSQVHHQSADAGQTRGVYQRRPQQG